MILEISKCSSQFFSAVTIDIETAHGELLTLLQQVTAFVLRVAHYSCITFIMGLCNIECVERIAQYLDVPSKGLEISNKNVSVIHLISVFNM